MSSLPKTGWVHRGVFDSLLYTPRAEPTASCDHCGHVHRYIHYLTNPGHLDDEGNEVIYNCGCRCAYRLLGGQDKHWTYVNNIESRTKRASRKEYRKWQREEKEKRAVAKWELEKRAALRKVG